MEIVLENVPSEKAADKARRETEETQQYPRVFGWIATARRLEIAGVFITPRTHSRS